MTMSWVADAVATMRAPKATSHGSTAGSHVPRKMIAAIKTSWVSTSQARRRPNSRDSHGKSRPSTRGAHRNFIVYGVPTNANMPIVPRSTPDSAIHRSSVELDNASGSPAENPRNKTTSTRRRK